jgi:hypothetical protein
MNMHELHRAVPALFLRGLVEITIGLQRASYDSKSELTKKWNDERKVERLKCMQPNPVPPQAKVFVWASPNPGAGTTVFKVFPPLFRVSKITSVFVWG